MNRGDEISAHALITRIETKLSKATSAIYRRRFGIGISERRVLSELSKGQDLSLKRLCDIIGSDKATISRAVKALESLSLIEVHVNLRDNRLKLIGITKKGRTLEKRVSALARKRREHFAGTFRPGEYEQLLTLLGKLYENVQTISRYDPDDF